MNFCFKNRILKSIICDDFFSSYVSSWFRKTGSSELQLVSQSQECQSFFRVKNDNSLSAVNAEIFPRKNLVQLRHAFIYFSQLPT